MLVASEEATSGSVIANAERIVPSSSGESQRSFCSGVPNMRSTSMLPVSGAAQLKAGRGEVAAAAGDLGERGVLEVGQPGAEAAGARREEEVPQPARAGLGPQLREHRRGATRRTGRRGPRAGRGRPARPARSWSSMKASSSRLQLLGAGVEREVHGWSFRQEWESSAARPAAISGSTAVADPVEALADGLALQVAVVDALEDHRELEVGQAEVEVHVAQVAPAGGGVPLELLRRRSGSPGPCWRRRQVARRRGRRAGRRPAAARRRCGCRRAWPSPSRRRR